jgi:hypothetical protein
MASCGCTERQWGWCVYIAMPFAASQSVIGWWPAQDPGISHEASQEPAFGILGSVNCLPAAQDHSVLLPLHFRIPGFLAQPKAPKHPHRDI